MRNYTMTLADCMNSYNDTLFTFYYEFPQEYKPVFEHKFLLRFGYRNIGFESYPLFKQMLESRLNELMPKYLDLYASTEIKYNPFTNYDYEKETFTDTKGRSKNYSTANAKGIDYSDSSGLSSGSGGRGTHGANNETDYSTDTGNRRERGINDGRTDRLDIYTDSPQNKQNIEGDRVNNNREHEKYFNDGYITTKKYNPDSVQGIRSENEATFNRHSGERGSENYENEKTFSTKVDQNKSIQRVQTYNDTENVASQRHTNRYFYEEKGLRGVLKSDVIIAWRKAFISVDEMLLNELEELFLGIY